MSAHTRLFVGNLPDNTNENVLLEAFSVYGEVTNLDVKSKPGGNDEKKFAFVTLSGTNYDIESCIKHFSTEIFNGSKLYVTRARESFLERLQRERQQAQEKEATKNHDHEFLSKKKPVINLSVKLNPRKRVNDDKVIVDHHVKAIKNFKSFDTKNTGLSPADTDVNNLKEKDKKKLESDKKRMESMKKKSQEFKQKQMIIKTGLVGIDKVQNKKKIFSDREDDIEIKQIFPINDNINHTKKNNLFDEDDDSADELNFEIKKQYEGKQGQKVLDLQSRYKSDKRFVLDERFVDDQCNQDETQSPEDQEEEIAVSQTDEKLKQLNILQDVLGVAIKSHITQPIEAKDNKKKAKLGMLRFDPSQPEHAKYLAPKEDMNQETLKKSKKKKTKEKSIEEPDQAEHEQHKVEVSKEQFYKVSDALKEAIAQPTTFSLRSLFGANEHDEKDTKEHNSNYVLIESSQEKKVKNPLDPGEKNPFVYDSSDSEEELESKKTKPEESILATVETKSVWKENLFFSDIDNRLKEMANRPTSHQMEALVEFLERNPGIARGLLRTQQAKVETRRKWQEFATTTNALGGVIKDGQAWAKYWAEKKSALKKLCQQRAQSMRRTGGGFDILPELSLLEQRLVAVMGGDSFATGSRGLAVDPFPQSNLQPSPSILEQPSTLQAAEDIGNVLVLETQEIQIEQVQNPLSPVMEAGLRVEDSEQQGGASFVQSASRRAPRLGQQSRQSRRVSFLDTQVRRFEEIESRRVEAETQTAQALSQIAAAVMEMVRLLSVYLEGERRDHSIN